MNNLKGPDGTTPIANVPKPIGSVVPTPAVVPSLNRRLGTRLHRSRRGFASGKSRLSLDIDADGSTHGASMKTPSGSTPASTSSSCSSDVIPWWEVEYQCPPPGHLGAHVVRVSVDEPGTFAPAICNSTTLVESVASTVLPIASGQTSGDQKIDAIRLGVVLYETPERARRSPHSKLTAIRDLTSSLLVDSSPSQKRKMRSHDAMDCDADLFSSPGTKELKRFHAFRLKKSVLPSPVATPFTLVQPLMQIGIGQATRVQSQAADVEIDKLKEEGL